MVMPWTCECGHMNSDADMYCEKCQPEKWKENHWLTQLHKQVNKKLEPMKKIIFARFENDRKEN